MYVVADFTVATPLIRTMLILHELFEAIFGEHLILLVIGLVFLHVSFVLEREFTARSPTVEMSSTLAIE